MHTVQENYELDFRQTYGDTKSGLRRAFDVAQLAKEVTKSTPSALDWASKVEVAGDGEVIKRWYPHPGNPTLAISAANHRSEPLSFAVLHGIGPVNSLNLADWIANTCALYGCLTNYVAKDIVDLGFSPAMRKASLMPSTKNKHWPEFVAEWANNHTVNYPLKLVANRSGQFHQMASDSNILGDCWWTLVRIVADEMRIGNCDFCGNFIQITRTDHSYCSSSCRTRAHRERKE